MTSNIQLYQGDCLEVMKNIPDKSVDLVLCDLPYGTTACSWDSIIPFEGLWEQYYRVAKENAAIVLTASQPFTSTLINSNIKDFRYELIWEKEQATNFMFIKKQFGKSHENIAVFYRKQPTYNAQKTTGHKPTKSGSKNKVQSHNLNGGGQKENGSTERYPCSVIKQNRDRSKLHPTQKPVALMEYMIKTYTNEGMTVLDNCMGSGTTGVACVNTNRKFIGIEKDEGYFKVASSRIEDAKSAQERIEKA